MLDSIGFQEIFLVAVLVLLLFGPRGISGIMRDLGKWAGSLKRYRDDFTREMMALSEPVRDEARMKEEERARIRKRAKSAAAEMTAEKRRADSARIAMSLFSLPEFQGASALFCFISLPEEVLTLPIIEHALSRGMRVYAPYCRPETVSLGLARIQDPARDLVPGVLGIPEPVEALRSLETDPLSIDFFIIPGVSFDHDLNRLGRGKGYFDRFLRGIKGKKPVAGLAFDGQIHPYVIPHYDHDVRPDLVVTPTEIIRERKNG
jgi:5-formyltetrahydrofolate cyclo-ligase